MTDLTVLNNPGYYQMYEMAMALSRRAHLNGVPPFSVTLFLDASDDFLFWFLGLC